ncbi:hypothetical protein [Amycolatopsis sp. 195334CR]|uniref:hypothetical protein n=1 Tax=Amycolatopsis sp. 195334CR TaxID=2814588 RepID=UPI001A907F8E|nr:hypothetical protein [Amycolatopsis sp. 195334CR]MBN6033928.1 hypothetical protein [Amycolatopsis sp. 195334CR]
MWRTDPADQPTWVRQPAERDRFAGPYAGDVCVAEHVGAAGTELIRAAMDAGQTRVTVALLADCAGGELYPVARTEYVFSTSRDETQRTAVAGPDGTATVTLTRPSPGTPTCG